MSDNKSRDIFYGVVAIATLIVAILGATLAYFSITAKSNEGAVNAKADVVSISYNDSQQVSANADKLIPSSLDIVKKAYEKAKGDGTFGSEGALADNVCVDTNGRQVCSIYRFTVSSDTSRTMIATLNSELNTFTIRIFTFSPFIVPGINTVKPSILAIPSPSYPLSIISTIYS